MEHRPLDEIQNEAVVVPMQASPPDSSVLRSARLERLATILEQHEGALRLFSRVEYMPDDERVQVRADDSPLTVAHRDPVLRAQGLAGDRMGDAVTFFNLTENEAHVLLCDCHTFGPVTGQMLASRVRAIAQRRAAV